MPWHLTLASESRYPLFPEETSLRGALRALAKAIPDPLLFCLVDDHVHLVIDGEREQAGRQAQILALTLRPRVAQPLASARIRPVKDRSHLFNLLGYLIQQPSHHTLGVHPLLWEGSCLPDLLGARLLSGMRLGIWGLVPRLSVSDVARRAGLDSWDPEPNPDLAPSRLVAAVAAVLAVPASLRGKEPALVHARAMVCQIMAKNGFSSKDTSELIRASAHSVRCLLRHATPDGLLPAVQRRLALEDAASALPLSMTLASR